MLAATAARPPVGSWQARFSILALGALLAYAAVDTFLLHTPIFQHFHPHLSLPLSFTQFYVCLVLSLFFSLLQVTAELYSPQGIQLGRWTTTWVPKPQPLLFRMISSMLLGPWRMLGLLSDTTRVELGLVEAFQNPAAPAGGWGSVPGYRRFVRRQQQQMQAWDEYGSDGEEDDSVMGFVGKGSAAMQRQQQGSSGQQQQQRQREEEGDEEGLGHVPGPRALWLRVSLSGRCYGQTGPPRVYNARAKLDIDRGG
jgi:hypothetical protein